MKNMAEVTIQIVFLTAIVLITGCNSKDSVPVKIYGSTTIEPIIKKIAKEFNEKRGLEIIINGIGSNAGIDSLIEGKCDIAMSSTELSPFHKQEAHNKGVPLKPFLLGYDVIIPIVHPSNKIDAVSFENLVDIYKGNVKKWSELGGEDTVIDVTERSSSSGTYDVWHNHLVPKIVFSDSCTLCKSNSSILAYVAEHANAIGYVSAAYLNPDVKPVKVDGISILENDSLLSKYHMKRPLYLYVNENRFKSEIKELIIFLIISESGRDLIRKSGLFTN
ncbi:MAG: phosphate ABC transporter substrate-binding protein [Fibrobacter sp.]|nr:phosphate ABC transporter substrate-binding protein [Fibrobacter sp.]